MSIKKKRMAQFRYFGENNAHNFPENMLKVDNNITTLPTSIMLAKYSPILKLTITTIPGIVLDLHINDTAGTVLKYVVGATGILDFNFDDLYFGIRGIEIEPNSITTIKANPENYFIITIVYEVNVEEEE